MHIHPRRSHDPLDVPDIEPATYEVRFAGNQPGVLAVTLTVEAFSRMDAIRLAVAAAHRPRAAIESTREV